MPKVNQTMLDKLVDAFKGGSQRKPEIIQQTTFRDPLGYTMEQRRSIVQHPERFQKLDMTPQREVYQQGIDEVRGQKMKPIREEKIDVRERFNELQSEFNEAYDGAYKRWMDDLNSNVSDEAPLLEYGFEPEDLEFHAPSADLRDYWPGYAKYYDVFEREADDLRDKMVAVNARMDYARSPEYRMQLQTETPRYRRYQDAMQRRDINHRAGRVNAAIMNLARQGYSLPEIREILRRQGRY